MSKLEDARRWASLIAFGGKSSCGLMHDRNITINVNLQLGLRTHHLGGK